MISILLIILNIKKTLYRGCKSFTPNICIHTGDHDYYLQYRFDNTRYLFDGYRYVGIKITLQRENNKSIILVYKNSQNMVDENTLETPFSVASLNSCLLTSLLPGPPACYVTTTI